MTTRLVIFPFPTQHPPDAYGLMRPACDQQRTPESQQFACFEADRKETKDSTPISCHQRAGHSEQHAGTQSMPLGHRPAAASPPPSRKASRKLFHQRLRHIRYFTLLQPRLRANDSYPSKTTTPAHQKTTYQQLNQWQQRKKIAASTKHTRACTTQLLLWEPT